MTKQIHDTKVLLDHNELNIFHTEKNKVSFDLYFIENHF